MNCNQRSVSENADHYDWYDILRDLNDHDNQRSVSENADHYDWQESSSNKKHERLFAGYDDLPGVLVTGFP